MLTAELIGTGVLMGTVHVLAGPDHLSALATLSGSDISEAEGAADAGGGRRRLDNRFLLGVKWGVGHSVGLLAVGGALIAVEESSSEWIGMDERLSVLLESFVGVFMLALGCYGLHRACKNRRESVVVSPESLKLNQEGGGDHVKVHVVEMTEPGAPGARPSPDSSNRSGNSIARMMEEALDIDSAHGSEQPRRPSERSREDDEDPDGIDASIRDAAAKTSGGMSASFIAYKARNRPKLSKATSLVRLHAPEKSITSPANRGGVFDVVCKRCPSLCTTPGLLALLAGIVHGVAGPGGVLGVIPAMQLRDAKLASIYLGTFCLTSTLVMGGFAACYGTFSEWLAGRRYTQNDGSTVPARDAEAGSPSRGVGGNRVFIVEAGSASLSVAVGIVWLALLSAGMLEEVFS